ncbi:hypothetical protein [Nocardioides sp. B-3]|uniref:hypothetical protein n=1 Tax=Nocardioides sp. B-3 TaxID=2895565 RepID=UPI003FA5F9F9
MAQRAAEADRLPTFREYAEARIASRRNSKGEHLRPTTRDKYLSSLRVHIYPTFGEVPLDWITGAAVRSWHEQLDATNSDEGTCLHNVTDHPEHRGYGRRAPRQEPGVPTRRGSAVQPQASQAGIA